ncbi:MAG TPA: CapA family protein, partial [Thermoleophilaceae bacterium]|nr:CapA family protein [Thermoleophilaceae bacterium]
ALPAGAAAQAANPEHEPPTVQIGWAGDMAFGRDYGLPPGGPRSVLREVRSRLRGTELMAGNLEGTLGSGGPSKCGGGGSNCFAFQAPASYAGAFKDSGFDVVNLANNHTNDFGPYGLDQTLAALDDADLPHAGRPGGIKVMRSGGLRVAFVGFAPYPWAADLRDIDGAEDLVREADGRADLVVAMMHAGAEGSGATHVPHGSEYAFGEYRGQTRRFAHAVVKAGADLVVGSGPHVVRGIECYKHRVIAYSLGNFAGYRTFATGGVLTHSGILRIELDRDGSLVRGRLLPVRFEYPGTPRPGGGSISFVRGLSRDDFGDRACRISRHGYVRTP